MHTPNHRVIAAPVLLALLLPLLAPASEVVVIKGSDTLGSKMVPLLVERFQSRNPEEAGGISFEIAAEGSGTGIAAAMDGTADIGMSSRGLRAREIALAEAKGVALNAIPIARDGIAVIVNDANPVDGLTLQQIEGIFTGDIDEWAGVADHAGAISAYTRNTSSGTYGAFRKLAMANRDYGTSTLKMASNEVIVSEVAANPNGIGYVGLAYVNTPGIKVLSIDGTRPRDGARYPLARPLYLLVDGNKPINPTAEAFIAFTLGADGQRLVRQLDFLPVR